MQIDKGALHITHRRKQCTSPDSRIVPITEVLSNMQISCGSVYQTVLGFTPIRFLQDAFSKNTTNNKIHYCLDIHNCILDQYHEEGDHIIGRIVTDDETWVHHFKTVTKSPGLDWIHMTYTTKKKFRPPIKRSSLESMAKFSGICKD